VGFPIRTSADQSFFAAPRGLSQRSTSFIASQRQGIHRMPLGHLIALIINAHPARQRKRSSVHIAAHMTPPRRRFSSPCHAIMLRCSEIAHRSRRCVTIDSRSDPTSSRCQISRLRIRLRDLMAQAKDVLCGRAQGSAGGARRNRTDDLLLAKQALSQLSYGPSRYTEASIRGSTRAPDHRYLFPESGGPGKI
jgi:hypothetical protein